MFAGVALIFSSSTVALALTFPQPLGVTLVDSGTSEVHAELKVLAANIQALETRQQHEQIEVASKTDLEKLLRGAQLEVDLGQFWQARLQMHRTQATIDRWRREVDARVGVMPGQHPLGEGGVYLPIVMFHDTPPDLDAQLSYLESAGYTVVSMDQAAAGLRGAELPPKPVVLTFDDGFASQFEAFEILKQHNMKATFYIINGGEASHWCLGADRRYGDPLQPPEGCGDGYLNWDQIRMLDRSGLITIGGHTLDHENLTLLPPEEQRRQIAESKAGIERQLGHRIRHFAYPYGAYDETTAQLAREAGYITAVTTMPGTQQFAGTEFTLVRQRFMP